MNLAYLRYMQWVKWLLRMLCDRLQTVCGNFSTWNHFEMENWARRIILWESSMYCIQQQLPQKEKSILNQIPMQDRRWPPSISRDDGCTRVGHFWLLHLFVWLCRLMRKWQSLPQRRRVWAFAACSVRVDLRVALFFLWQSVRSCSACFLRDCTAAHQESQEFARLSHHWMPIAEHFMSLLQVSLYLSRERPLDLAPNANSPYSRSLGIRPSSMRLRDQAPGSDTGSGEWRWRAGQRAPARWC